MDQSPSRDVRFCRLFDAHRVAVQAYCFRRLGAEEANDAVAEVFLVAWRKIEVAPTDDETLWWLYGIARNVVRNARRSQVRWQRLKIRLGSVDDSVEPGPEVQVVQRAEDRELLTAVDQLTPLEQELLRLRNWEELPSSAIATVTGLSVRAVETRLTRIRKKLARLMEHPSTATASSRARPIEEGSEG